MTLLSILGVLSSAIFSGTSLLYATLGEVIHERSGIVNLGLEGVLLVSAMMVIPTLTGFAVGRARRPVIIAHIATITNPAITSQPNRSPMIG